MNQTQTTSVETSVETAVQSQYKLSLFAQCVAVQNPKRFRRVSKYAPMHSSKKK